VTETAILCDGRHKGRGARRRKSCKKRLSDEKLQVLSLYKKKDTIVRKDIKDKLQKARLRKRENFRDAGKGKRSREEEGDVTTLGPSARTT